MQTVNYDNLNTIRIDILSDKNKYDRKFGKLGADCLAFAFQIGIPKFVHFQSVKTPILILLIFKYIKIRSGDVSDAKGSK